MTNDAGKLYLNQAPSGNCVLMAGRKGRKSGEMQVQVVRKKIEHFTMEMKPIPKPSEEEKT